MTKKEIEELLIKTQRMAHILGVCTVALDKYISVWPEKDKDIYYWIMQSIENAIYLDKPLPPFPKRDL